MFSEYVYQSWKKTKYGFGHAPIGHYVDNKTMQAGIYTPYGQKVSPWTKILLNSPTLALQKYSVEQTKLINTFAHAVNISNN